MQDGVSHGWRSDILTEREVTDDSQIAKLFGNLSQLYSALHNIKSRYEAVEIAPYQLIPIRKLAAWASRRHI